MPKRRKTGTVKTGGTPYAGTLPYREAPIEGGLVNKKLFLGQDPADENFPWKEWHCQAYVATQAHRAGLVFSAGMEGASKSKATQGRCKATGQAAGEADMRFYLPMGLLALVELKRKGGKLTKSQEERLPILRGLGFSVEVIECLSPLDGWNKVKKHLEDIQDEVGLAGF